MIGHNVVIDNGTYTVKGGFSTADTPKCRIPTLVGHGRHKVHQPGIQFSSLYSGVFWVLHLEFTKCLPTAILP